MKIYIASFASGTEDEERSLGVECSRLFSYHHVMTNMFGGGKVWARTVREWKQEQEEMDANNQSG